MSFNPPASPNNRLLDLEQKLRGKKQQRQLEPASPPPNPSRQQHSKPSSLSFKAYIFDTGEPIIVDYPSDQTRRDVPMERLEAEGEKIELETYPSNSDSEPIEPEQNSQDAIAASLSQDNSTNNGFHHAFGDISDEMKYATSFDLGEVEVEIPFDEFDQQMAQAQSFSMAQLLQKRFDEFDQGMNLGESLTKSDRSPPDIPLLFTGSRKPLSKPLSIPPNPPLKEGGIEGGCFEFSPFGTKKEKHPLSSPLAGGNEGGRDVPGRVSKWLTEPSRESPCTAIEPIIVTAGKLESLPSGSLICQDSSQISSPLNFQFDFQPMVLFNILGHAFTAFLPIIGRVLVYTLVFLAAISQIILFTLVIAIYFITRTKPKDTRSQVSKDIKPPQDSDSGADIDVPPEDVPPEDVPPEDVPPEDVPPERLYNGKDTRSQVSTGIKPPQDSDSGADRDILPERLYTASLLPP